MAASSRYGRRHDGSGWSESAVSRLTAYIAGPDVFFPDPVAHAARKAAICARHGIVARSPIESGVDLSAPDVSRQIYDANRRLMLASDIIIANLTPFRGPSADDGTAFEVGFFDALGRPCFAYSNVADCLAGRTRRFVTRNPDPGPFSIEDFGLPCNLMLPHAVEGRAGLPMFTPADGRDRPFDDLETFERPVGAVAVASRGRSRAQARITPWRGDRGSSPSRPRMVFASNLPVSLTTLTPRPTPRRIRAKRVKHGPAASAAEWPFSSYSRMAAGLGPTWPSGRASPGLRPPSRSRRRARRRCAPPWRPWRRCPGSARRGAG